MEKSPDIGNLRAIETLGDPTSVAGSLARGARILAEHSTEEAPLIGYMVTGLYADGAYSSGHFTPVDHVIGRTLFAAYMREVLTRELTGQDAADDYHKRWVDQ